MNDHRTQSQTKGAALLIFMVLFVAASLLLVLGVSRGTYNDLLRYRTLEESKHTLMAVEGALEDALYRHKNALSYSATESFSIDGVTIDTSATPGVPTVIIADGQLDSVYRSGRLELGLGTGASFNFGVQTGNGGFAMSNNSSVVGNVFSNGTVEGQGSATIYGDIISAGPSGYVDNVTATGSVWAHDILNSDIDGDAYCDTIDNSTVDGDVNCNTIIATTVGGSTGPGPADQAPEDMPITDATIEEWKTNIEDEGSLIESADPECSSGTYTIDTDTTLGDVKIECDVVVSKNGTTLTMAGPIWIAGNLTFSQGPTVEADTPETGQSVQFIVDNESNRETSSKVLIDQATNFVGQGDPKTFIMVLSMNNSAESGGSEIAVDLNNSAEGDVLIYASHGRVDLGNNISLKEVTAYQIDVSNGAEVIYESGLANLLFTSGPGGSYTVHSWREIE